MCVWLTTSATSGDEPVLSYEIVHILLRRPQNTHEATPAP